MKNTDWDGEVDELRSRKCINVDGILEWRCVADDNKEDSEDDVQCMTSEQTVNITGYEYFHLSD